MTRSVFVSSCGDPFLTMLVYKLFKERWYDEVETFYIDINNHCDIPKETEGELLKILSQDSKVHIIYHPRGIGNGRPITEMTLVSREDLVMLLEDDGFIFESGIVSHCFQQIESDLVDIVGSPRFSCGQEVADALKVKYNLDYSGYGDVGPNWWPNFFFCKRSDLLKTDLDFASKTFYPGTYYPELNLTPTEINHGDTFVWACIQLRNLGLRSMSVPQHKADPFELQNKEIKTMNWVGEPMKWIHGGSLSAGWGGYLSGRIPDVSTDIAKQEIESRVAFWKIASDVVEGFDEFKIQYKQGIEDLIINTNLNRDRIQAKYNLYRNMMRI